MSKLTFDLTMSLDGFIAGPNQTLEQPLGGGGDRIHEWMYGLATFRERHGMEGGETNADSEVLEESVANTGAPLFLGDGVRLFDQFGAKQPELEGISVSGSPAVTHLKCRVVK